MIGTMPTVAGAKAMDTWDALQGKAIGPSPMLSCPAPDFQLLSRGHPSFAKRKHPLKNSFFFAFLFDMRQIVTSGLQFDLSVFCFSICTNCRPPPPTGSFLRTPRSKRSGPQSSCAGTPFASSSVFGDQIHLLIDCKVIAKHVSRTSNILELRMPVHCAWILSAVNRFGSHRMQVPSK